MARPLILNFRVPHLSLGDRWGSSYYMLDVTRGKMVRPERFELPAFWFPPPADSIQLSPGLKPGFFLAPHGLAQSSKNVLFA